MIEKLMILTKNNMKEFLQSEKGKRLIYEVKSFALTFGGVLVALVGVDKFSSLDVIITNKEIIIGSIGAAFARTVLIYLTTFLGLASYRESTKKYN